MAPAGEQEGQDRKVDYDRQAAFSLILEQYHLHDAAQVVVPEGVTQILPEAFKGHGEIESVQLPETLRSIGKGAFRGCTNLREITIPDSVEQIGDRAFNGCQKLQLVQLPASLTKVDRLTFGGCNSLEEVQGGEEVAVVASGAFSGCSNLRYLPDFPQCKTIESAAFAGCASLDAVVLANMVRSIGNEAFRGCRGISYIRLPGTIESLGRDVFVGCVKLRSIEGIDVLLEEFPESFPRSMARERGVLRPQDHHRNEREFKRFHAEEIAAVQKDLAQAQSDLQDTLHRIDDSSLWKRSSKKKLEDEAFSQRKQVKALKKRLSALQNPTDESLRAFLAQEGGDAG